MKPLLLLAALQAACAVAAQADQESVTRARNDIGAPAVSVESSNPGPPSRASSASTTLFTASWCGHCRQARTYLTRVGIRYTEVDVNSLAGRAAFAAAGGGGVPLLVVKGQQLRGYSELAYDYFFARLD